MSLKRVVWYNIVGATWCLMTVILINAYASNLISFLTVPKLNPIVESFEDLAASRDLKLAVDTNSVIADQILVSHNN